MKQKFKTVITLLTILATVGCCGCNQNNKTIDNNEKLPVTDNIQTDAILTDSYLFMQSGIGISGERFMFSDWENPEFLYTCTDFTCSHTKEGCTSLREQHTDDKRDIHHISSKFVYYKDKMIIFDVYEITQFQETVEGENTIVNKIINNRITDVYEADMEGGNRKLVLTFEGGPESTGTCLLIDNEVVFGGAKSTIRISKHEEDEVRSSEEYDEAIFALNLDNYSVKEYEIDDSVSYGIYHMRAYDNYVYAVLRTDVILGDGGVVVDNADEKWYRIDLENDTCELINEIEDKDVAFFGAIDNKIYYSYYDDIIYYKEVGDDTQEKEFIKINHDIPVGFIYDDMIAIMTEAENDGSNYKIKYVWYDSEGKELFSHEYNEWLIFSEVIGDRIIYMRPFEEGIPQLWINKDDVDKLETDGTLIGNMSVKGIDTIE